MNVAYDALAGGNAHRKFVLDRVAGLVAGNRGVGLEREPSIAICGVRPGVDARPVVGVDHVARGAAAGAVVARMIVGPQEVQRRVEQPGFLKTDEHGIGAVLGSQAASAQAGAGLAGLVERVRNADLWRVAPAALEDAEDIPGLRGLEAGQGVEERHDTFVFELELCRRGYGLEPLRSSVHAVALAVARALERNRMPLA